MPNDTKQSQPSTELRQDTGTDKITRDVCRMHPFTPGVCPVCAVQEHADRLLALRDEVILELRGTITKLQNEIDLHESRCA